MIQLRILVTGSPIHCLLATATMSKEELSRKKKLRTAHKASTSAILDRVRGVLGDTPVDVDELLQLKLSLEVKLETLKTLDSEILDLTPDTKLGEEINNSDALCKTSIAC